MSGSPAEERLRALAEARLRERYPDARIIHELVVNEGSVRMDLAAVTREAIVLVEIKSERDTLSRLGGQLKACRLIGVPTWLVAAEKWRAPLLKLAAATTGERAPLMRGGVEIGSTSVANPEHLAELNSVAVLFEGDDGLVEGGYPFGRLWELDRPRLPDSRRLLRLLWAHELRVLAQPWGVGSRATRDHCIHLLHESMTGGDIRRGVCAALRRRQFARADEAVAA